MTDLTGRVIQSVVCEVRNIYRTGQSAMQVALLNRLGRKVSIATQSFLQTWRFISANEPHPCSSPDCDRPAWLRMNASEWRWVCDRHLPSGRVALLPQDPADANLAVVPEECPRCSRPLATTPGTRSEAVSEEDPFASQIVAWFCGACESAWVPLYAKNDPEDGVRLCEEIIAASSVLEELGHQAIALAGTTAYAAIRSIAKPHNHVTGVPYNLSNKLAALNVVVLNHRTATTTASARMRPAIGSTWSARKDGELVEVLAVSTDSEEVVWRGTVSSRQTTTLKEFLANFTTGSARETVAVMGSRPKPRVPPPGCPRAGDTWWNFATQQPVFIVRVEVDDEEGTRIHFQDGSRNAFPALVEDFLKEYTFEPPSLGCAPGQEWIDEIGRLFKVSEVRLDSREIVGETMPEGQRRVVTMAMFQTQFRRLIRKSAHALVDEDIFGDEPDDSV